MAIPLSQSLFALVNGKNYEWLNQWKWHALWQPSIKDFYAVRHSSQKLGKRKSIFMHRLILGLKFGDGKQTDHKNHCGLDNRETNLRICTYSQNFQNKVSHSGTSKFKGVAWNKNSHKWQVQIMHNYQAIYLGLFNSEIDAAKVYDTKARELFGEFAHTNF